MFDFVIYLFFLFLGGATFIIGLVAFGYGLYGMSVSGFDKAVRNFSLTLGIILISIVLSVYFAYYRGQVSQNDSEQEEVSGTNVIEGYKPSKPITFPHNKHADIDCKYCHGGEKEQGKSKIRPEESCKNCHKQVSGTNGEIMNDEQLNELIYKGVE